MSEHDGPTGVSATSVAPRAEVTAAANGRENRDGRDDRESREGRESKEASARRSGLDPLFQVRTADIEPYIGLRYLSKLFRFIALILILLLVAEVVTGLVRQGTEAIPTLVAEVSRLIVLAGLLWGAGDLAILLIDVGHDVRAARILIGRQTAHLTHAPHELPRASAASAPPVNDA